MYDELGKPIDYREAHEEDLKEKESSCYATCRHVSYLSSRRLGCAA